MARTVFVLKPSVVNALGPAFLIVFTKAAAALSLPALAYVAALRFIPALFPAAAAYFPYSERTAILCYAAACLLVGVLSVLLKAVSIRCTSYYFYEDSVEKRYKLLGMESQTTQYSKVVDIEVRQSFWDRLLDMGDVILHTAGETSPKLCLSFVRHPGEVRSKVQYLMRHNYPVERDETFRGVEEGWAELKAELEDDGEDNEASDQQKGEACGLEK